MLGFECRISCRSCLGQNGLGQGRLCRNALNRFRPGAQVSSGIIALKEFRTRREQLWNAAEDSPVNVPNRQIATP